MSSFTRSRKETKTCLKKLREDMVRGPSTIFTGKAVVGQTRIRLSSNTCKSIVGIDASQLYPYAMCQSMPTGLYARWEFNVDLQRFKPRSNETRSFENMVMAFFKNSRPECNIESFYTTGTQRKIDSFSVDGFCSHCNTISEALGCFYHFWECPDEDIVKGQRKREMDALRRSYLREKNYSIIEMWESQWKLQMRENHEIKTFVRSTFPYKRPLSFENLLSRIRKGELFGYVQSGLRVPEKLREKFQSFPPSFKNILVSRSDIGDFMEKNAEENKLMTQPRRMLISSFHLINGTIITPLLNFYSDFGLECDRIYRFVQYTPMKCFNSIVQSAVDARRKGDENPHSSVVAATTKLLANSSYGYQIMDRSRYSVTKYLIDEKAHKAISSKFFKKLNHLNDNLYEIESVKADVEHKAPIIMGFFILQYAKFRMLELYYKFFHKFCDFNSFEEREMDPYSLYLALAHDSLEDCIKPDMREVRNNIRMNHCSNTFAADSSNKFFLALVVPNISSMTKESLDDLSRNFVALKFVCAVKPIAASIRAQPKSSSVARGSTKERWRNRVLGPWKSTGAYWTRKQMCSQLFEASELFNIQSARTNKLKEVYHTFILKELYSMMVFTRKHFFCKRKDSIIKKLFSYFPNVIFHSTFLHGT